MNLVWRFWSVLFVLTSVRRALKLQKNGKAQQKTANCTLPPLYEQGAQMSETASIASLKKMHKSLGEDGHWNHNDYTLGLFNGLELALASIEDRAPALRLINTDRPTTQQRQQSTESQNATAHT